MKTRWMLSLDDGVTFGREVTPISGWKFGWSRNLDRGEIFFRVTLAGKLQFGRSDFDLFYSWDITSPRRCRDLYIRHEWFCDQGWMPFWTGRFSAGRGFYDHDMCQCSFKIDVFDRYTCILEHLNDKFNALTVGPVDADARIISSTIEFAFCISTPAGNDPNCANYDVSDGWDVGHSQVVGVGPISLVIFWRERTTTICIDGTPATPPGSGWILLSDDCVTDGTAEYARIPIGAWPYGNAVIGTCPGGEATEPASACDEWQLLVPCTYDYTINGNPFTLTGPYYICLDLAPVEYNRSRLLFDVLSGALEKAGCTPPEIQSDFFEWNPPGDAPGYSAGINYITGEANTMAHLLILQKSDAIDPSATNPATIGETTIGQLLEVMRKGMNVFWDVDDLGNLRLEHWHYWTFAEGLDLYTDPADRNRNERKNKREALTEEIPSIERFRWQEALNRDFIGLDIVYDSSCVVKEGRNSVEETSISNFTTDLVFIDTDPDAISKQGFVLLATTFDGSVYHVIVDEGGLTGTQITNAPLSWANLHRDFFTWNRYLRVGNMNGIDQTFDGIRPNLQQVEIHALFCCELREWDAKLTVKTEFGQRFLAGRNGFVEKAELDGSTDLLSLTLRYAR